MKMQSKLYNDDEFIDNNLPNRIYELYDNEILFITGGSGFLGKVLIEKLLRTCPKIKKIYLLLRTKKGRSPNERIHDIFNNVLFDPLKKQQPNATKKCIAISGDINEVDLGLSMDDRHLLENEVNFIYHSAAAVKFDDSLTVATRINTRGTKYMLDLARNCKNLKFGNRVTINAGKLFIHISTAYAYPKEDILYERPYKPPADPESVLNSLQWITEDSALDKKLLGDCPNTYTFSKALAEDLVVKQIGTIPLIIVRPSVVVPTWIEPFPGWCNNLQGPMGLFVAAGKGVLRSMYVTGTSHADFLPVDIVINGMICATWHYLLTKKNNFYHLTSSSDYKVTWNELLVIAYDVIEAMPFNYILWYPGGTMQKFRWIHNIFVILFQVLPALFVDLIFICVGQKPFLFKIQKRIIKGNDMFEYYTNKPWLFNNENATSIRQIMNKKERKIYKVDAEGADTKKYIVDCIHWVRINILKETDDMIPSAKRIMKIMWTVDIVCKIIITIAFFYYLYKWVLAPIFNL